MRKYFPRWFAVAAWMGFIFLLSSIPSFKSPLAPTYDFPLRKLAHIMEYSVLAILVFRAFELRIVRRQAVALAIVISVLYAILDEWHQMFVRGRQGAWQDIIIDIVGIAIIYMWLRTRKREPGKPEI